ncbi:FHA domain-containing protein [Actinomadura litoris]|uniref:FHA domain-containing protein n=1 Tax=Actinomadura litoris TaxID=2678616 RepID=UPI001FA7BD10|nr:FHA domain-containing protein [Actinomadura litoris]
MLAHVREYGRTSCEGAMLNPDTAEDGEDDGAVEVSGPEGPPRRVRPGERLTFGRGPDVDLAFGERNRWMSRRVGEITVEDGGVRLVNLSAKHALVVEAGTVGEDPARTRPEPVRLRPRLPGDPAEACVLTAGSALVGSALMIRENRAVHVRLPGPGPSGEPVLPAPSGSRSSTVAGITMNPETRQFMVALLLCAPWLRDATRVARLPTVPEIGRQALELTGAHYLLRVVDREPRLQELLAGKVNDHLKALLKKLVARTLLPAEGTVGHTAVASALIHYDVLGHRHLALFEDAYWLRVQANKWSTCMDDASTP